MGILIQCVQYAIMNAIFHSLWTSMVLAVVVFLAGKVIKSSDKRYLLYMSCQVLIGLVFIWTFVINLNVHSNTLLEPEAISIISIENSTFEISESPQATHAFDRLQAMFTQNIGFRNYGSVIWIAGWLLFSILYILQFRSALSLKSSSAIANEELQGILERVKRAYGWTKDIELRCSDKIVSPFMTGVLKPVIYMPISIQTHLSSEQIEVVLAHELAHIRRHDFLMKMIQNFIHSLLFFNPIIWWLTGLIDREREYCCDDEVFKFQNDPIKIADTLVSVSRSHLVLSSMNLRFSSSPNETMKRVKRLFNPNQKFSFNMNYLISIYSIISICSIWALQSNTDQVYLQEKEEQKQEILHDGDCKIVAGVKTRNGKKLYGTKSTFTYDDLGREKKWYYYYEDGSLSYANESIYDSEGRRIKYLHYNSKDELDSYYQFTYDDRGFEQSMEHYNLNDELLDQWIYTTDQEGKIIRQEKRNPNGTLRSTLKYEYQDELLLRKNIYNPNDKLISYMEMTYDDKGLERTFGIYDASGREKYKFLWTYECKEN